MIKLLLILALSTTVSSAWAGVCMAPETSSGLEHFISANQGLMDRVSDCITPDIIKKCDVYQPDLELDGEALAHQMAATTLEHKTESSKKLEFETLPTLAVDLYNGKPVIYPGAEKAGSGLIQWLMKQKEAAVTPATLYTHALELAGGNVQHALILCWNELSDGWNSAAIERNSRWTTMKLRDITGELVRFDGILQKDRNGKSHDYVRGDNFSAWYHFFGTALHAYTAERSSLPRLPTATLIKLEESVYTGLRYDVQDSKKRIRLDRAGATFGETLALDLEKYKPRQQFSARKADYLVLRPDVYGPSWALQPGQHPRDFGTHEHTLTGLTAMQKVLILHHLKYDNSERFYCYAGELIHDAHLPEVARAALYALAEIRTKPRAIALLQEAKRSEIKKISELADAILNSKNTILDILPTTAK